MKGVSNLEHHKRPLPRRSYRPIDDAPPRPDVVQSVIDMRKVFSNLTEEQFIEDYRRKYRTGLLPGEIRSILKQDRANKAAELPDGTTK